DGIVQSIGVEVLHGLADALLVIGGRDDLQIIGERQALFPDHAIGALHDEEKVIHPPFETAADDDFIFPARAVIGKDSPNGLISPSVAADRFERWRDVVKLVRYSQVLDKLPAPGCADA